jgi:hypothetical protein
MRGLFLVLAVDAMQLFIDFGRFGALSAEPPMLWNQTARWLCGSGLRGIRAPKGRKQGIREGRSLY